MSKKKIKDRPIPCQYLERDKSERAHILFSRIEPYLEPGQSFLDITCGTSPMAHFIINHLPHLEYTGFDMNGRAVQSCRVEYPGQNWHRCLSSDFVIDARYDFVIHIGVSSIRYNSFEIHERLLSDPGMKPHYFLLESGDYKDSRSDTRETFEKISGFYHKKRYSEVDEGVFELPGLPVPMRRFVIFEK